MDIVVRIEIYRRVIPKRAGYSIEVLRVPKHRFYIGRELGFVIISTDLGIIKAVHRILDLLLWRCMELPAFGRHRLVMKIASTI